MTWVVRWILTGGRVVWEVGFKHSTGGWCAEGIYHSPGRAQARTAQLNARQRPWRIYELLTRGAADN
jgi:hypothetical protein